MRGDRERLYVVGTVSLLIFSFLGLIAAAVWFAKSAEEGCVYPFENVRNRCCLADEDALFCNDEEGVFRARLDGLDGSKKTSDTFFYRDGFSMRFPDGYYHMYDVLSGGVVLDALLFSFVPWMEWEAPDESYLEIMVEDTDMSEEDVLSAVMLNVGEVFDEGELIEDFFVINWQGERFNYILVTSRDGSDGIIVKNKIGLFARPGKYLIVYYSCFDRSCSKSGDFDELINSVSYSG